MNQDKEFIQKLKQIVLDNLTNEQFSVEHLSEIAGISRSHLHRRLKKLKGVSISQFIREIRLDEALKLLQKGTATTTEIAFQVGFNSTSYFHKCFHDRYGYPPSEAKMITHESMLEVNLKKRLNLDQIKSYRKIYRVVAIVIILLLGGWSLYNFSENEISSPIEKSIAVLPFKNLSEDEENQHFGDGLVEDLLSRLATINEFKVISRTSSETYRNEESKKISLIASELGASYILEGSVRKSNNKVRITVQLIDAKHDDHIWIKTFDRDLADIFEVQSEIAIQIASGLSTALTAQQTTGIQKNQTENIKAFELYQLGRFHWGKRMPEAYDIAIEYFDKAIAEDSGYALAYAGLGDTHFLMTWLSKDSIERRMNRDKAEAFALKALELNPNLVEAHTVLATLYFFIDWDWAKAEKTFSNALKINPNYSTLHHRYSEFLSYINRHEDARKHIDRALELDPLSFVVREVSSELYFFQKEFQSAVADAQIAGEVNKEKDGPILLQFWINYLLENDNDALNDLKKWKRIIKNDSSDSFLDSLYYSEGNKGLMQWVISTINDPIIKGQCFAILGENDSAIDLYEAAFNEGNRMPYVPFRYSSNHLNADPRFIKLIAKMNLPWDSQTNN